MRKQVLILVVFKSGDLAGIQNNSHPSSFIAILAARLCWDWSLSIMNLFIPRLRDRNMTCSSLLCATKRLTVKLECLSRRVFVNFRIALNFVSRSVSGERWWAYQSRGRFVKYDKYRVFPTSIFMPGFRRGNAKKYWLFAENLHSWALQKNKSR